MHYTLSLVVPLPLQSILLHRNLKLIDHFPEKLKLVRLGLLKILTEPTVVTYLTGDGRTFHTHRNYLISECPKQLCFFSNSIIRLTKPFNNS